MIIAGSTSQYDYRNRLIGDPYTPNPQTTITSCDRTYVRFKMDQSVVIRFRDRKSQSPLER